MILNPRILIFDEATSALDALSEKEVMSHIERVRQGRTVLMIAHRLSTVRRADMILVMKDGVIVEYGNHEQLLKKNGIYATMYREQEGSSEVVQQQNIRPVQMVNRAQMSQSGNGNAINNNARQSLNAALNQPKEGDNKNV